MISPITTHVTDALGRLTSAYGQAANVRGLISVFAQAVQDIENALGQVAQDRLDEGLSLSGASLDVLGRLVGIARQGTDDATYQALLLGTIAENASDGSVEAILAVAAQIFQAQCVFFADVNAPAHNRNKACATLQIAVGSPRTDASLYPLLEQILTKTLAAGTSVSNLVTFDATGAFAFAGPQPWVSGFCSLDGTKGGPMAHLVYTDPKETL